MGDQKARQGAIDDGPRQKQQEGPVQPERRPAHQQGPTGTSPQPRHGPDPENARQIERGAQGEAQSEQRLLGTAIDQSRRRLEGLAQMRPAKQQIVDQRRQAQGGEERPRGDHGDGPEAEKKAKKPIGARIGPGFDLHDVFHGGLSAA